MNLVFLEREHKRRNAQRGFFGRRAVAAAIPVSGGLIGYCDERGLTAKHPFAGGQSVLPCPGGYTLLRRVQQHP